MQVVINKFIQFLINFYSYLLVISILKSFYILMILDEIDELVAVISKLADMSLQFLGFLVGEFMDQIDQISMYHHLAIIEIEQFIQHVQDDVFHYSTFAPILKLLVLAIAGMLKVINQLEDISKKWLNSPDLY